MTAPQIFYVKNKRERNCVCNLCGQFKPMTWDHVPPKGGIELSRVEMQSVLSKMSKDHPTICPVESQDGLKFRTICCDCNNRLGRLFDPTLNDFAIGVGKFLKSTLTLPDTIQYKTYPARLIRGILGHIVAAKIKHDHVVLDERVKDFLFDFDKPLHKDIHIHYWVYPYSDILVMRDFIRGSRMSSNDPAFCNLIKYFPVAYIITDKPDYEGLLSLSAWSMSALMMRWKFL